jgi:hypothetical protein
MVIFGLGKQDSENLVRNDTACDVEAGRSAMWARTLGASLQTVAWGKSNLVLREAWYARAWAGKRMEWASSGERQISPRRERISWRREELSGVGLVFV